MQTYNDPTVKYQDIIRDIRRRYPMVFQLYVKSDGAIVDTISRIMEFSKKIHESDMAWSSIRHFLGNNSYDVFQIYNIKNSKFMSTDDPDVFHRVVRFYNFIEFTFEFIVTEEDVANYYRDEYIENMLGQYNMIDLQDKMSALGEEFWTNKAREVPRIQFFQNSWSVTELNGKWIDVALTDRVDDVASLDELNEIFGELDFAAVTIGEIAPYDYTELERKIREKSGTRRAFSHLIQMSEPALSKRLNNQCYFQMPEIELIMKVLGEDKSQIGEMFFTRKSWKTIMGL